MKEEMEGYLDGRRDRRREGGTDVPCRPNRVAYGQLSVFT